MQHKYLFFCLFIFTLWTCNKKDDLLNNEFVIEKPNGITHSTMKDDRDGKIYATVILDTLEWMNENLDYKKDSPWIVCPENEDGEENCDDFGFLYLSNRNFCPEGWQKPTLDQWFDITGFYFNGNQADNNENLRLGGHNFQYAGYGFPSGNFYELEKTALYVAQDDGYFWYDTLELTTYFFTDEDPRYTSCRCVRKVDPTDSPFFDQCADGIMNGNETGIDCGGTDCDPCPATCSDGVMNGDETGIDCGGSTCPSCPQIFTDDRDGQEYSFVEIGDQIWMAENLNYSATGLCYDDLNSNCDTYGRLYSYNETASQTICPEGWHIPSDNEFKVLESYLGMSDEDIEESAWPDVRGVVASAGDQLKAEQWQSDNSMVTLSGFDALPSGIINNGISQAINQATYFITSTLVTGPSGDKVIFRALTPNDAGIGRGGLDIEYGISCRCIKD